MKKYYQYYKNIYQELNQKTFNHFSPNSYTYKFSNIYNKYILNPYLLYYSYYKVKQGTKNDTPGSDGITIKLIENTGAEQYINQIVDELANDSYQPSPLLRSIIPKGNGEKRLINIPTLKDKIVQKALTLILNPIYETIFFDLSMAFRPNRSQLDAVGNVSEFIINDLTYIIKTDIEQCFNNLNRQLVLDNMDFIYDEKFKQLIKSFFCPQIVDKKGNMILEAPDIAQGTVIAPILSNIALHTLDNSFITNYNSKHCRMIRYADDLLFLMKYPENNFINEIDYMLNEIGLNRNTDKTKIIKLRKKEPLNYLGYFLQLKQVKPKQLYLGPKFSNVNRLKSNIDFIIRNGITENYNKEVIFNDIKSNISSFNNYYRLSTDKSWLDDSIRYANKTFNNFGVKNSRFIRELRQDLFGNAL